MCALFVFEVAGSYLCLGLAAQDTPRWALVNDEASLSLLGDNVVGLRLGAAVLGLRVGSGVGALLGDNVVGLRLGAAVLGLRVGSGVVGLRVGSRVVGVLVGVVVGVLVGVLVGLLVGVLVGFELIGEEVGVRVALRGIALPRVVVLALALMTAWPQGSMQMVDQLCLQYHPFLAPSGDASAPHGSHAQVWLLEVHQRSPHMPPMLQS
jgi:hypothetical protein